VAKSGGKGNKYNNNRPNYFSTNNSWQPAVQQPVVIVKKRGDIFIAGKIPPNTKPI
jgi:hypothetical protein